MTGTRLLVIHYGYPRPDNDSGSVSITNTMRLLVALGFQVSFMPLLDFAKTSPYRAPLEALGVRTIAAPEHRSPEAFLQLHAARFAVVVLSAYHAGGAYYEMVRERAPKARIIFNAIDLHHARYEQQANLLGDPAVLRLAVAARQREMFLISNAEATIVVSETEQQRLRQILPGARVFHVPLIRDIVGRNNGFAERANIGFVGHYPHAPNPDAVFYFARDIWPLIRRQLPEARFKMIGAGWPDDAPLPPGDGIDLVGHVPDIATAFEALRLTVAPLRFGAGAKGKVVSSLAHGVPGVLTPIAAEGMGLRDGIDALIAAEPADFADRVVALYRDAALWNTLSDAGLAFVTQHHSFEHGVQTLRRLLVQIGALDGRDVRPADRVSNPSTPPSA